MSLQGVEHGVQHCFDDFRAALNGVITVDQHFGFNDRYNPFRLADGSITRQHLRICFETEGGQVVLTDLIDLTPLGKACPLSLVDLQAVAKTIQPLRNFIARCLASGFNPLSTLMPGTMPCFASTSGNGAPSSDCFDYFSPTSKKNSSR